MSGRRDEFGIVGARGQQQKMTQRDRATILFLQRDRQGLVKKERRRRCSGRVVYDDFITLFLIKWPLSRLISVTGSLLLRLLGEGEEDDDEGEEGRFANETPIHVDGTVLSFRRYFSFIHASARDSGGENVHMLLRACFLIALVYDERVRRFVLAQHSWHLMQQTVAPDAHRAREFIVQIEPHLGQMLSDPGHNAILEVTRWATDCWLELSLSLGQGEWARPEEGGHTRKKNRTDSVGEEEWIEGEEMRELTTQSPLTKTMELRT